jgi:hypothetical protein
VFNEVIHVANKIAAPFADVGTIVQLTRDQMTKMRERLYKLDRILSNAEREIPKMCLQITVICMKNI